jgi:transcriptional regulator with XRE-family HTH domain
MDKSGKDLHATERWEMLHKTPYTVMVGLRLRRIREGRRMTQHEVVGKTRKPRGRGFYSQGFLSRLEAGYANAPLYAYVDFANTYELDPARLMGPEDADKKVGDAEMALVRFLRRLGISPDEAMARLARESA